MLDTTVTGDSIRIGPRFAVTFHRTLRIPGDDRAYPLPPGLGTFPIYDVSEYREKLPDAWRDGTVLIPMYRREALWLGFHGAPWKPNAVKVSVGGINVLTGKRDDAKLGRDPQDYLVTPNQPWLDGITIGSGIIRQFVAVPLGQGDTVEAALTGEERNGGIQLSVFEPRDGVFPDEEPKIHDRGPSRSGAFGSFRAGEMGIGVGGQMHQKVYPDPHGIDVWDQSMVGRAVIYLLHVGRFQDVTGLAPPPTPVSAQAYTEHGLPWFDLYDDDRETLSPAPSLVEIQSVNARAKARGVRDAGDESVEIDSTQVHRISPDTSAEPQSQPRGTHRPESKAR